ncbi:pyruvate dehydrogenase (acetyl-transferring) E1 component subunit alpha [Mycolicibacillus trivialis]|uniref:Pyruvate dehydrogenase (Acetyl-transferring) E1 component subunit alpha n=1 Tax=Mycolicibacillus trivialis TaxID=1798 RepID=A0A1X2ENB7_9MYCO|nr:pyruvate dehydrogenase (acetyl-transferring) E1 component subunit alpha [Mycolicibacillus trivialis]ORX07223.1 pyruvate dehydrogenase (acetyl-transferring) E1 component subunit alpha [Mycolicibacillus trivialis]
MGGNAEATVEVTPVQLIGPAGNPASGPAAERYRCTVPDTTLLRLYELMAVTRDVDTELVNLQRQGELALVAPCRGQEAAQVGAAAALRDTDWLFPQYRELGVFLTRGFEAHELIPVFRGSWTGGSGFAERRCAPVAIPIATQALHAVGAAMGAQRLGEDSATVAFLGDGATSQGDTHAALNMASVYGAGCVFYVQNNQWAISVPVDRQVGGPSIAHRAIGYGMPGVRVDGNDVLACYAVMTEAAERARRGEGPTLIEAVTYRLGPHTTSDDPTRYRTRSEVERWNARDPLPRYRTYLQGRGLWTEQFQTRVTERSAALRTELRDAVVGAPDPPVTDVFDAVYAEITPELARQRAELIEELAREVRT